MEALASTSRIVADELRRAERSINLAARDTAQFLLTALDATEVHGLSPAVAHRSIKATVSALSSLVDSQDQMAMRAHPLVEKVGRQLGLSETSWGEGAPKPTTGLAAEIEEHSV